MSSHSKQISAQITINKPVAEVFAFTINPANTPKWVDAIMTEETNEWPVRVGTIYRNKRTNGEWSEYTITEFEPNKKFVMRQNTDDFNVGYEFSTVGDNATRLDYNIWKETGELPPSLTVELLDTILGRLKDVIKKS